MFSELGIYVCAIVMAHKNKAVKNVANRFIDVGFRCFSVLCLITKRLILPGKIY